MDYINELRDSLNVHLGWNKARITCFVHMLLALLTTRTVNLNKLACVVIGEAQLLSRYRRIQRFFAKFALNYTQIAGFIFKLFFITGGQWYLSLVSLAGLRLADGELLIVATSESPETAIITYGLRWEIESLFGCFKGRGFNFEDTHITDKERIKKLVALLAIAFAWAHRTGEWQSIKKPIKIKKHGRPATSLFRYGLDFLCNAIVRLVYKADRFHQAIDILNGVQLLST